MPLFASLCTAAGLALVHLFAGKLRFLEGIPRSRWLSIAGGVSVAYVFVHLLPELSEHQDILSGAVTHVLSFLEHHVYLIALLGLSTFYGLERLARASRLCHRNAGGPDRTSSMVFWLHIASFSLYNTLVGYFLLHRIQPGDASLLFFFLAMALHFLVNDYGLREHHKELYTRYGRWLLAAAVLLGWGAGLLTSISEVVLAALMAFLAGGVILNVLKEELPEERESRFGAFALGAAGYAVILILQ